MAIEFAGANEVLTSSVNLPATNAITMMGWFKYVSGSSSAPGSYTPLLVLDDNTTNQYLGLWTLSPGVGVLGDDSVRAYNESAAIGTITGDLWFFGAFTCVGTAAGNLIGYYRNRNVNTLSSAAIAGFSFTPTRLRICGDTFGASFTGDGAMFRTWSRVLSAHEILVESFSMWAKLRNGLRSDSPGFNNVDTDTGAASGDLKDYANGNHWAATGNLRNIDDVFGTNIPPVSYGGEVMYVTPSAASSITGSLAQTLAALTVLGNGSVDIAGTLARTLGSLTAAGVGTVDIAGTLAQTLDALTLASAGSAGGEIEGTLTRTLAALTAQGTGAVTIDGALARTLEDIVLEALGAVTIEGQLARTLAPLVLAGAGNNGGEDAPSVGDLILRRRRRM